MKSNKPVVTLSHSRRLIITDYGDRTIIESAPHGSAYASYQTANLPVRPAPPAPQSSAPPPPKPPSPRQQLRQTLGLDTIGKPK